MINAVLMKIKESLRSLYGDRLKGLVLYGSEARGDAVPGSDIDVLCILEGPVSVYKEISATVEAMTPVEMEMGENYSPISIIPADYEGYMGGSCEFYREVRKEGIPL